MAFVYTNLSFKTEKQSLWRPGPATDLTITSGDTMIWDPDPIVKDFGFSALGFSLDAQFYLDVKFGLLAYASLGTGGHFNADYTIGVNIGLPAAIIAGNMMTFDYRSFEVVSSSITTAGFGTPESSSAGKIGAGLDLIIEVSSGFRNITFGHWFGTEGPYNFSLINVNERIELLKVDPLSPEFSIDLTDGVTLTARLPTGASIDESTSSNGGGRVEGAGVSERQFLSLDADLDALLVKMLEKISFPPVTAVAKFLGEVVFAEHSYDISDYLPFLGKDKVKFNFTLLDITANAGLNVTEEVSLDINRAGTQTPDVLITLVSDNGTAGNTADDIRTQGLLGNILTLQSPNTTGTGTAIVTATYEINRGTFFHGVGVGINASITIDALSGYLSGSWVPDALAFSFGPLFSTQIPQGGLQINLGNIYEDTFEIDGDVFNKQTEQYEVFYVEAALAPTNWNPNLPNAEETIYNYFRAAHTQLAAIQQQYSNSGFLLAPPTTGSPQSSYNYTTEAQKVMFIWTGLFTQTVTLNTTNGSVATVDLASSLPPAAQLVARHSTSANFMDFGANAFFVYNSLLAISNNPSANTLYRIDGKTLSANQSINVEGTAGSDAIVLAGNHTAFIDGGGSGAGQTDLFVANFAALYGNVAIRWDLNRSVTEEQDGNPATLGGITLFDKDAGIVDLTVRNIERAALMTGSGNDYLVGWQAGDIFVTGEGADVVILPADGAQDLAVLGGGDDAYISGFLAISFAVNSADLVYGGTGLDNAFITPGINGLRYNIMVDSFESPNPVLRFGATNGIGYLASFDDITTFYGDLESFGYSIFATNPASVSVAVNPTSPAYYVQLQDGAAGYAMRFAQDVEYISVVDGGAGNDLAIYMGGTRYEGGGGIDTFAADFQRTERYFGDRGGLNIVLDRAGIDGLFGTTTIDGFERLVVSGTTTKDVLMGGGLNDYLEGNDGDDILSGGTDTAADTIYGGSGNDLIFWSNSGADRLRGGNGIDRLEISTNGAELHGLIYRFTSFTTGQVLAGSEIYYWAYDPASLLLDALNYSKTTSFGYSMDISFGLGIYASTHQIEVSNIRGSGARDDLMIYQGGTHYVGGEAVFDQDTFVADLSAFKMGLNFTIKDDEALDGSDGYLLANQIYLQGIDRGVLITGDGDDRLMGGRLNDYFAAGAGNDTLFGDGGANVLYGGDGNDLFLWTGAGSDTMVGGAFRDLLAKDVLLQSGGNAHSSLRMFNASGAELTVYGPATAFSALTELEGVALDAISASRFVYSAGSVSLDYANMSKVMFAGTDAYSEIALFQYGTRYWGGEGDGDGDLFIGDFRYFGNPGIDFGNMTFDARTDAVYDAGEGLRIGGFERFVVHLGQGTHLVRGGDLGDGVFGHGGQITFLSGLGDDLFDVGNGGGSFDHTGGHDTLRGGAGIDVLSYTATSAVEVSLLDVFGAPIGPVLSRVGGLQSISTFQTALQTISNNVLVSYGSHSILHQGFDEFFATGSQENDVLLGGYGTNLLQGGAGDDVLIARYGTTVMMGGAGVDTYVFDKLFYSAVILNENDAYTDTLLMFTGANFADLTFFAEGADLLITVSPLNVIDSVVRVVDYFATAPNGYDFSIMTQDAYFVIDLSGFGAFTGLAKAQRSLLAGSAAGDDFGAGNHVGREIHMGGGDDFARAGAGSDWFFGGTGQDGVSYIDATAGVALNLGLQSGTGGFAAGDLYSSIEHVAGSLFDDTIAGSIVANTIVSDEGNDQIFGGDGDDALFAGKGDDLVDGGNDDDMIQGDEGHDSLFGNYGSDALFGGTGNDYIDGGENDDLIETGDGNDTVLAGAGDDVITYTGSGLDLLDGGIGNDWLSFKGYGHAVSVNLLSGGPAMSQDSAGLDVTLATVAGIENLRGTDYADVLIGDGGDNIIDGGLGFDAMTGHAGNDTFISRARQSVVDYSSETGGSGIDLVFQAYTPGLSTHIMGTDSHGDIDRLFNIFAIIGTDYGDNIQGNDKDNEIIGGAGADFLNGLSGNDAVYGDAGNDVLWGFDGSDTLVGGSGYNILRGEAGNDVLMAEPADEMVPPNFDVFYGGTGFDAASYQVFDTGIELRFGTQVWHNGVQVGALDGVEHLIGGMGNDTVQLAAVDQFNPSTEILSVYSYTGGYDSVTGAPIYAGGGTISYALLNAAVSVNMAAGAAFTSDSAVFGQGIIRGITQFSQITSIVGSNFGDYLQGAALVPWGQTPNFSQLYGGAGNDTLIALGGMTELDGGDGDDQLDIFVPIFTGNNDPIINYFVYGGAGFDTLKLTNAVGWSIDLGSQYSNLEISGVEGFIGGTGNDTLAGDAGANRFEGAGGDDSFDGRDGADVLVYTAGIDSFTGGLGIDTLDVSLFGAAALVDLSQTTGTARTNDTASALGGTLRDLVNTPNFDVENVRGTAFSDQITANGLRNVLDGGAGNDTIYGAGGNDVLVYSGGFDRWYGGDDADVGSFATFGYAVNVNLARAANTAFHRGGADVVSGTTVNIAVLVEVEHLIGTLYADLLAGDGADNMLWGNGGADRLYGQAGHDSIYAGNAGDLIFGGDGNDSIVAGITEADLADTIDAGAGDDTVLGGAGHDSVLGQAGFDALAGEAGNDSMDGGAGNDTLYGGRGDDSLLGGLDQDILYGGDDNDTLRAGAGGDAVYSGSGDDLIYGDDDSDFLYGGDGSDTMLGGVGGDWMEGGDGFDIASYADKTAAVLITLREGGDSAILGGAAAEDVLFGFEGAIGTAAHDTLTGNSAANMLIGGAGNDALVGQGGKDMLQGGLGQDTLDGGDAEDLLTGDAGNDLVYGGAAYDLIYGGDGNDKIYSGADQDEAYGGLGNDLIVGDAGDDLLYGDDGNDTVKGGDGIDALFGGIGNDTLAGQAGGDALYGGAGIDTADYSSAAAGVTANLANAALNLGEAVGDIFSSIENILGSAYSDILTGDGQSNTIFGGAGNDVLDGDSGADTLLGGSGNDVYIVNSSSDRVYETTTTTSTTNAGGKDTVQSSVSFDLDAYDGVRPIETLILTGAGNISALGNALANLLVGNGGANILDGRGGADRMIGGAGNDVYYVDINGDQVFETIDENSIIDAGGIDTLNSAFSYSLDASVGVRFVEKLVLLGTGNFNGYGNALDNTLTGNAGNNLLNGGLGNDSMFGGAGNDTYVVDAIADRVFETITSTSLVDTGGVDTVQSAVTFNLNGYTGVRFVEKLVLAGTANANGTGNDLANQITGNSANNTLNGGLGADTLTGGLGADTFVFSTALGASNVDVITDFTAVDDTIRLDDAIFTGLALGALTGGFVANTTGLAGGIFDRIIYETDTGKLFFDADGSNSGAAVQFATLTPNLTLGNADFFVF